MAVELQGGLGARLIPSGGVPADLVLCGQVGALLQSLDERLLQHQTDRTRETLVAALAQQRASIERMEAALCSETDLRPPSLAR